MDRMSVKNRDFKPGAGKIGRTAPYRHHHLLTVAGAILAIGIIIGVAPDDAGATRNEPISAVPAVLPDGAEEGSPLSGAAPAEAGTDHVSLPLDIPAPPAGTPAPVAQDTASAPGNDRAWTTVRIKNGDNLSVIFGRHGISPRDLHQILALGGETRSLKNIYPGEEIHLQTGDNAELLALEYDLDESRTLAVERSQDGFASRIVEQPVERRIAQASGIIDNSLFLAAQRAGLSDNLTMELAGIFGWDVDFSLDIRGGDRFAVLYEELYKNGEKLRDGAILAAEFVNRDRVFKAVRHADANGKPQYYTPEGKSLRKAFLRSPVAFTRVSSGFSMGRMHPILNRIRSHKGVDYAAPTGTPVKATGDGKVVFRGVKGGYGNAVIVQHGTRYSTLYGHLSRFARGMQAGKRVTQGQIIGYVGSTGLATGPHLHYEFHVDGVHRNPLKVAFPDAAPLGAQQMAQFIPHSQPYLARLEAMSQTQAVMLAQSGETASTPRDSAE